MISNADSLRKRGFVYLSDTDDYAHYSVDRLKKMAESGSPHERTIAIRIMGHRLTPEDPDFIALLIERLPEEKALYTRIEISEQLEKSGEAGAMALFPLLGEIGDNQHHEVPTRVSKKKSYPLPRDIAARILAKMHKDLFPLLLAQLKILGVEKRRELLDAIGYMAFYNPSVATKENFKKIEGHYLAYQWDEVIVWKTATCCSAFPIEESIILLKHIKEHADNPIIGVEVQRSLLLLQHGILPT